MKDNKRSRKQKRPKLQKSQQQVDDESAKESEIIVDEEIVVKPESEGIVENEIVCDVKLPVNAEAECVDVEGGTTVTKTQLQEQLQNKNVLEFHDSNKTATNKRVAPTNASNTTTPTSNPATKKSTRKRRDSATSSEEERWLSAIESGKLEDVDDELKKMKDPKLMTARQRAIHDRGQDKDFKPSVELLMSLPNGYREREKPQTAEDIQKATIRSQRRKQQADERREKDKKKTMERLLKKQENKQRTAARNKQLKATTPMLSYRNTAEGAYMHLPEGYAFPLLAQAPRDPPKLQLCGIVGCGKPKIYNCSKTNLPLCSFACFRQNKASVRELIC